MKYKLCYNLITSKKNLLRGVKTSFKTFEDMQDYKNFLYRKYKKFKFIKKIEFLIVRITDDGYQII